MFYFIPAWYQQNKWCENEQNWHARRLKTEFDDTVKQVQLFHRNKMQDYQIMLLGFYPNFRHFLHRQSVFHAPYWSCFDAIQCVKRRKARLLSYHNLIWPAGVEFLYTPFVMVAMLNGEKYAEVEFGEDGNPIQIDMFESGKLKRRNIYDDRGFVSSTILFEKNQAAYQDYLTEQGTWKLRHFIRGGHVEINEKHPEYLLRHQGKEISKKFSKLIYSSIDEVIYEVLSSYLELTKEEDIFCVAMHRQHAALLQEALQGRKKILSFYGDRYVLEQQPEALAMIEGADYLITDSKVNAKMIEQFAGKEFENMMDITPYDSRVDFGISSQLDVQKILVPVDGLDEETFFRLTLLLAGYITENTNARIHLFTRQADYNRKDRLLEQVRDSLRIAGYEEDWAREPVQKGFSENRLDDMEVIPQLFFVEQCVDELAVSKCMREQRIIVDVRAFPELYLQIMAISQGIPQIVMTETQFVEHEKNGQVLKKIEEVPEMLNFYLAGQTNWNEAMLYAYELGKKYTTGVLLDKWKEVIDFIG